MAGSIIPHCPNSNLSHYVEVYLGAVDGGLLVEGIDRGTRVGDEVEVFFSSSVHLVAERGDVSWRYVGLIALGC